MVRVRDVAGHSVGTRRFRDTYTSQRISTTPDCASVELIHRGHPRTLSRRRRERKLSLEDETEFDHPEDEGQQHRHDDGELEGRCP